MPWIPEPGSGGGGGGGWELIDSLVVGSPQATVTFNSIPGTFDHLMVKGVARHAGSTGQNGMVLRFNNDTGTNYGHVEHQVFINDVDANATTDGGDYTGAARIIPAVVAGANAASDGPSQFSIEVMNYAGTTFHKMVRGRSDSVGDPPSTPSHGISTYAAAGIWRSTAAITRIDLAITTGVNFVTGSSFYLYGL